MENLRIDTRQNLDDFREFIFKKIKEDGLYQCVSKFIAIEEAGYRNEYCIDCECGSLSPECGGRYYPLVKIAETFWNIKDIHSVCR